VKAFNEFVSAGESEGLFEMANLSPKRTGLPFVVWISPKAGAPHDVRVKVSKGPKVNPAELISVAIRPDVHVVGGGDMSADDLALLRNSRKTECGAKQFLAGFVVRAAPFALLRKWLALNQDVIIKYWNGEIEYTEDAIAALKPVAK
jgi:hypothetical protein